MTPVCSIVIPVSNYASMTRQCLNTLLARPAAAVDTEIVIVDDGSTDATPRLLASYGDRIRVVTHAAREGFATSCNHGGLIAAGEFIVFLNNDTIPLEGWLDALVDTARVHPDAGIIGSKLLFPDGTVQHAGVVFASNHAPTHLYLGFPGDHPAVNKARRFQAVTGACLLIRRDLFERLGGFDATYFNVYEDVDLCLRAGQLGHHVRYCPASVLYHLQSVTRGNPIDRPSDPVLGARHSLETLLARWRHVIQPDEIHYYWEDGLIDVGIGVGYPRRLTVSPLVGRVEVDGMWAQADRIIGARSRQVGDLLSKNIALETRLREIETRAMAAANGAGTMPRTWPGLRRSLSFFDIRSAVAGLYLEGSGLEVGPLHAPLPVDPSVRVRYVDRMTVAELRRQYPELDRLPLVEPDIIDDGERLTTIADASQNFVIASHFLEHCQDPIGTVKAMWRVVKPGGILYIAVPDKRYTFDRRRPVTTLDHLIRDHEEGPAWSRVAHFEEWVALAEDENIKGRTAQQLMDFDYSIHFHVWTQIEAMELFAAIRTRYDLDFDIETVVKNGIEVIFILRKGLGARGQGLGGCGKRVD